MDDTELWKLAPECVFKPWGLVHEQAAGFTGLKIGVGEIWLASAQTGAGNYSNTVAEPNLRATLAELLDRAEDQGDRALKALIGAPALTHLEENPHRGKTEAWCVRDAVGRCGFAAGPASPEDAARLEEVILEGDLPPHPEEWSDEVRRLFGLIEPLEGGEIFLVPAGTLHTMFAIGPDSRLVIDELQQGYGECLLPTLSKILMVQDSLLSVQVHPDDGTVAAAAEGDLDVDQDLQANPTVRVYDFGRRPGEYPELGFKLVDPEAGLRRVTPLTIEAQDGQTIEFVTGAGPFLKSRIRVAPGRDCPIAPCFGSYHVLHCVTGHAELSAGEGRIRLSRGETAFVPAALETDLRIAAEDGCELFDDTFPVLMDLRSFLAANDVSRQDADALLDPPRADG